MRSPVTVMRSRSSALRRSTQRRTRVPACAGRSARRRAGRCDSRRARAAVRRCGRPCCAAADGYRSPIGRSTATRRTRPRRRYRMARPSLLAIQANGKQEREHDAARPPCERQVHRQTTTVGGPRRVQLSQIGERQRRGDPERQKAVGARAQPQDCGQLEDRHERGDHHAEAAGATLQASFHGHE